MNPFCDLFWKYFESVGLIISNSFCSLICKLVISLLNPIFHLICNLFWKNFEFVGYFILNPFCDLFWKNFESVGLIILNLFCNLLRVFPWGRPQLSFCIPSKKDSLGFQRFTSKTIFCSQLHATFFAASYNQKLRFSALLGIRLL